LNGFSDELILQILAVVFSFVLHLRFWNRDLIAYEFCEIRRHRFTYL